MIYYLNMGFIAEQALRDVVATYLDRLQLDDVYANYHISVVNEHPFAHMILEDNPRCADSFPSIIISTESDSKSGDLMNVPPQYSGIGLTSKDIDELIENTKRIKTKINEKGEVVPVVKKGVVQKEVIPGYVFVTDEITINNIKEIADSRTQGETEGMIYGVKSNTRRKDRISVEIWADNNQLKNELYEHLRLLFSSTLDYVIQEKYKMFDPAIFDGTVQGQRSSNFNFDFDTLLFGSHIAFDIEYNVAQIILDSEINNISKDLIVEVINHVKE